MAFFSLADPPGHAFGASALDFLTSRYAPNLRAAELFLYEYFQQLPAPGVISGAQLQAFASAGGY